jgi:hypothetical protein
MDEQTTSGVVLARSIVEQFVHDNPDCPFCLGYGIVCEDHPARPWDSGTDRDCRCGGAGMPCPDAMHWSPA